MHLSESREQSGCDWRMAIGRQVKELPEPRQDASEDIVRHPASDAEVPPETGAMEKAGLGRREEGVGKARDSQKTQKREAKSRIESILVFHLDQFLYLAPGARWTMLGRDVGFHSKVTW